MQHSRSKTLAGLAGLALTGGLVAPAMAADSGAAGAEAEGTYIVMLETTAMTAAQGDRLSTSAKVTIAGETQRKVSQAEEAGIDVEHTYETLGGYSAELSADQAADLAKDPDVASVERDTIMTATPIEVAAASSWGLDRIDQRDLPLDGSYTSPTTGDGVTAYIIDTGVYAEHSEFEGRTGEGFSAIEDGEGTNDCQGHGTHVAGTVAGSTYGVAPGASVVPVRVLGCDGSGSTSGVIAGMDWVAENADGPSVANMSLGGPASEATDAAVDRMVASGVTVAVAAGNESQDACNVSPARAESAITVGSTTETDDQSGFSNWGTCLDLFAPGSDITSAWIGSPEETNTISGTSMASPHAAGAAALFLGANPDAGPSEVVAAVTSDATPDKVQGTDPSSPNLLLYVGAADETP
ncbi:S8 family peptidase [Ornithinimicrobium panacihumi]|uniref:S8 family peptidase n=1 Tax=Ornithinimicrobium panacihumi TaxID=2008449 RepID=UPI003F88916F